MSDALLPELSTGVRNFICAAYGILLLGTLLLVAPDARRYFVSERWGGYTQSSPSVDRIQNPRALPVTMLVWIFCGVAIALNGLWSAAAALINLALCRYFFVSMRWRGVLRGMGAPGFMVYWLAAAVFLLQYTATFAPGAAKLALLVLQVDFALIFLSAGIYKFTAGYPRNFGMELGLVNPEWGYWAWWYRRLRPSHWAFWVMNQAAWSTEVVAAVLMLIPSPLTHFVGGLLIVLSFAFVATQIRLGLLCHVVVLCGVLFFAPATPGDNWLSGIVPITTSRAPDTLLSGLAPVNIALTAALCAYLVLLPFAHAGLFYNFYGHRPLPHPVQRLLESYTNFFGIIIWRVFSVDHLNFFIKIYAQSPAGQRELVSRYGFGGSRRFNQVGESITVTTLFTTLKYYPSNSQRFVERLLRYARTVPCRPNDRLVFEYVSILETDAAFVYAPVAEYVVDIASSSVEERVIDPAVSVRSPHRVSPVHEGAKPGSYAPLARQA